MVWLYINLNNICYLYTMIEIGYNFLKKDLNKIQRFKNPTLDIDKNRIKKIQIIKYFLIRINIII